MLNSSYTGINHNDSMLYIHPPRDGKYKILQFCPHPLFYKSDTLGAHWSWVLEIGSQWATGPYILKGIEDTFSMAYTLEGQEQVATPWGSLNCYKVAAISYSIFGRAHSIFYLHRDHGLVKAIFTPVNRCSYELSLISMTRDRNVIGINKDFLFFVEKAKSSHRTKEGIDSGLFILSKLSVDIRASI